ncbi:MAG: transcriptional regulator, partial [Cyanobacteria bacterium P01_D01_bin.73]
LPAQEDSQAQATNWVTQTLWKRLSQKLIEALDNISLEDLYYDARSWQAAQGQDSNFIV